MTKKYDVIIIGAGMAGLTTAIYLKRAGYNVIVLEENVPGGQLNKIPEITNYPGFTKISGPSLAENLLNQVNSLDIEINYSKVIKTNLNLPEKEVITNKHIFKSKYIVISTGKISKKLFNNDDSYLGKGISYCAVCDGRLYKNCEVAIIGSDGHMLDEALYLSKICKKVNILVPTNKITGKIEKINNIDNINIMYKTKIKEYIIENNQLKYLRILNDENENMLKVSGLFISIGSAPSTDIFAVQKKNNFILVNKKYMTSIENVYACGDSIKKDVYQLTTAASDGTNVAYNIIKKEKENKV